MPALVCIHSDSRVGYLVACQVGVCSIFSGLQGLTNEGKGACLQQVTAATCPSALAYLKHQNLLYLGSQVHLTRVSHATVLRSKPTHHNMLRMLQHGASYRVEHLAKDEVKPMINWEQIVTCKEVHDCGACIEQSIVLPRQAAMRMCYTKPEDKVLACRQHQV